MLEDACRRLGVHVVCGLLERDGDAIHNAAVLVGPDGLVGSYRKSHLPFLGVDRFVRPGDELPVFDTPIGRIGLEICYDLRFPEVTRSLALAGAEIVCLPTNWPLAAAERPSCWPAGARVREPDLPARRQSHRQGALGRVLRPQSDRRPDRHATRGDGRDERGAARRRRRPRPRPRQVDRPGPGEYEMHLFEHRRPDLYGALVEETQSVTT